MHRIRFRSGHIAGGSRHAADAASANTIFRALHGKRDRRRRIVAFLTFFQCAGIKFHVYAGADVLRAHDRRECRQQSLRQLFVLFAPVEASGPTVRADGWYRRQ